MHKDKENNFMFNYQCRNNHKGENYPINNYKPLLYYKTLEDLLSSFCYKNIRLYYCYKYKKYFL